MPPKKKKASTSPIVVGTVSTRSTRRQSIVNIDIPKTNKSPIKNCKISVEPVKEISQPSAAKNFSEKIKETYNKVFSKILESPTKTSPESKTDSKSIVENKALLQIWEDWSEDKQNQDSNTDSAVIKDEGTSELKSNEALLQILEDWTDDESQDDKKVSESVENTNESDTVQEIVKSDKNIGKTDCTTPISCTESVANSCELISENINAETLVDDKEQQITHMEMEVTDPNLSKTGNLEGIKMQEYVVEENESVQEEIVSFEEENIVEYIAEEIIADENVLMDTDESTTTTLTEESQRIASHEETIKGESLESVLSGQKEFVHNENKRLNDNIEENSQSVSTVDSNDVDVGSFFSKGTECKSTTVEVIQTLKYEEETNSDVNTAQSTLEATLTENISEDVDSNLTNSNECDLSEERPNEIVFEKNEVHVSQDETLSEIKENFVEPMDTTRDKSEDTIENRVAQMHLVDGIVNEEDIGKEQDDIVNKTDSIDMSFPLKEDIEKVIGVKTSHKYTKAEVTILSEQETDKCEIVVEKPKTRRTRSVENKSTPKTTVEESDLKSPKNSKAKEKKLVKTKEVKSGKEPKNKKKPSEFPQSKKTKEKNAEKKDAQKKTGKHENDQLKKLTDFQDIEIRRSSRIKSINVLKKKTIGHGLVRSKSEPSLNDSDISDSNSTQTESERSTPSASPKVTMKDKKSRWSKSSENICYSHSTTELVSNKNEGQLPVVTKMEVDEKPKLPVPDPVVTERLRQFVHLKENLYKTDRMTCKEAKKMTCDCFLTSEEIEAKEYGCGEDCLNRLLLIECGNLCQVGDRCTNKRFQKAQFAPVEVFNTEKKGLGLRAAANIPFGEFILEYVGEVLNVDEFDKRAEVYSQDKNVHYYFMSLRADAIIDATVKGNISRFINHSCDPNAETQKWTVNGELRIGFFSTRTILAGEEITFDYRFQRYGKEAQKCYCEATICRGWLGEQPDEDSEDEDEEEEGEEEEDEERAQTELTSEAEAAVKTEVPTSEPDKLGNAEIATKTVEACDDNLPRDVKAEKTEKTVPLVTPKRKSPRKKPRKDLFDELDPLDEEIEMLITTGLKNQAHTLKLSRLMVRAKEPPQRTKLLRILRRGELPCRRLFLDYHGLRLMHGYMIDAQHLVHTDKKYESLRLEMLQTLAVLPIPNKTMLQDSKVLSTVEKWATDKYVASPQDSDSNSPKIEPDNTQPLADAAKDEKESSNKSTDPKRPDEKLERTIEDQEEEIRFLASKLLEGWANLKEVFRIPKKERIEQMKEHEREANKKFMQGGYGNEPDSVRKSDRYRHLSRFKERETNRKGSKSEEKPSAEFIRLSKIERRKLFALQHELKEEERRLKQREMWRQHELNCMMIGTDPRFTAPFDPSRGYQYIWNPQIGQWQNYPLPPQNQVVFTAQGPAANVNIASVPGINVHPPQLQASKPSYPYPQQLPIPTSGGVAQISPAPQSVPPLHLQQITNLAAGIPQINSLQNIVGALPQNIASHPQLPTGITSQPPLPQYPDQVLKDEDPSQVKFMGPIPPPVKLPRKWKCAKDKYGRPYYYHIKIRKSQWEPPSLEVLIDEPDESSETESSSNTSSLSSDSSTENSDSDDDIDDTRLLLEVRKQMEKAAKLTIKSVIPEHVKTEETLLPSPDDKISEEDGDNEENVPTALTEDDTERPSIDIRLKEQFNLLKDENPPKKKRRLGLCEEIMISPRSEEDRLQFKEDLKRYKANKEKLKRQKEFILQQTRKQLRETESKKKLRSRATLKSRIKEMPDFNTDQAKKIKENFRANMASTVVSSLNGYRKPDCKEGRITNTEDFKHLARKLTHFVMLKEMKHIEKIEDLTCTDNVKSKAREYIRKYMSKFGEVYVKRNDSPDFKD